jgi:tRNA threonylcarbamoyladenosine biosynthesis protein TsaE
MDSHSVFLADAGATTALGQELARSWLAQQEEAKPILLLDGNLGAGGDALHQGIAAGLGIGEPVTSPSFALAQHYQGSSPADATATALVHLDLYRLEQPAAADELFAQEEEEALLLGALLAVEWPGRLSCRPEGAWLVTLQLADPSDPDAGRLALISTTGGATWTGEVL